MLTLPMPMRREPQSYIYIPFTLPMSEMGRPAKEGFPLLFAYLREHGLESAGAAFYNYRRIDMARTLDVEAGIPVTGKAEEAGRVRVGTLPGGNFLSLDWHGHYDQLMPVTSLMIGYARETGQAFDMHTDASGDHFGCRLEIYETDPDELPNPEDWLTRLAFKLRD
jgi:effector-binding domain-containing protein